MKHEELDECKYCGGNCPNDEDHACDGYSGDIDGLYSEDIAMNALVSILKQAQSLTSTISNDEEITREVVDLATALDAELNELIGLFDPNWMSYEQGYEYDPKLVAIALNLGENK
jgi:hypothetical protein